MTSSISTLMDLWNDKYIIIIIIIIIIMDTTNNRCEGETST